MDLSPALGTFLAGVVLADSEFRHELESDIEPFKGLLLGLFFITVGAGIDFGVLFGDFGTVLGLTLGVIALKGLVLFGLARLFRLEPADGWLFTLGLWDENPDISRNKAFLARAKELRATLKDLMELDRQQLHDRTERGWTPPPKGYSKHFDA